MPSRVIAIGDIHGCVRALDALLDEIGPLADDVIVTLGDYVDRGPDSRDVIDRLISLSERCRLIPLLGNHDQMFLEARPGGRYALLDVDSVPHDLWLAIGGDATLASYNDSGDMSRVPPQHFAFLEGCREWYETDTHLFTHANYLPEIPIEEQPDWVLRWESLRERIPGPHVSGKIFIVGHTSQKHGEIIDLDHLICVDTYCHGGGYLTGLEVGTGRIWKVDRDGKPVRTSKTAGRDR
ncbi:MAG: metallophosphoesterase family protein [Isosphaeraceae bacterium]